MSCYLFLSALILGVLGLQHYNDIVDVCILQKQRTRPSCKLNGEKGIYIAHLKTLVCMPFRVIWNFLEIDVMLFYFIITIFSSCNCVYYVLLKFISFLSITFFLGGLISGVSVSQNQLLWHIYILNYIFWMVEIAFNMLNSSFICYITIV